MPSNTSNSSVRRTLLRGKKIPECLTTLDVVCTTAAQSPEVQSSPIANQALGELQKVVSTARTSLNDKLKLAQALLTAIETLDADFADVKGALSTFETAVEVLAKGDSAVINRAGLLARDPKAAPVALERVSKVLSKPGKNPGEAILSWPAAPGATGYVVEINLTPQTPGSPWTPHGSGSGRRRVVKVPVPSAQFLARVASTASDATQSDWTDPILVTPL